MSQLKNKPRCEVCNVDTEGILLKGEVFKIIIRLIYENMIYEMSLSQVR